MDQATGTALNNKPRIIGNRVDATIMAFFLFYLEEIPKQEYFFQIDTVISLM